jgi:hypothetical protein
MVMGVANSQSHAFLVYPGRENKIKYKNKSIWENDRVSLSTYRRKKKNGFGDYHK